MNIRSWVFAGAAGLATFGMWALLASWVTGGRPLTFSLLCAALGACLVVLLVLQYSAQGRGFSGDVIAVIVVLSLVLPSAGVLVGYFTRLPKTQAHGDGVGEAQEAAAEVIKIVDAEPRVAKRPLAIAERPREAPAGVSVPPTRAPVPPHPLPVRVREVLAGRAWNFSVEGPTDLAEVSAHLRAGTAGTVAQIPGGRTYRFRAPGAPQGRVHLTWIPLPGDERRVKDAVIPSGEIRAGHAFLPHMDCLAVVWVERGTGPVEMSLEATGEPPEAAEASLAYYQKGKIVP